MLKCNWQEKKIDFFLRSGTNQRTLLWLIMPSFSRVGKLKSNGVSSALEGIEGKLPEWSPMQSFEDFLVVVLF